MTAPKRIQRQRTRGWRMPEGAVYVGRPSRYGNPFAVVETTRHGVRGWAVRSHPGVVGSQMRWPGENAARAEAVRLFRLEASKPSWEERIAELAGKDLACWCPLPEPGQPDLCHAAVLLDLANTPASTHEGNER